MMGEVVTKVGDLGMFAVHKSNDEESPVMREEYKRRGEELSAQSDELLAATNELLQDPDNPYKNEKFMTILNAVRSNIQYVKGGGRGKREEFLRMGGGALCA